VMYVVFNKTDYSLWLYGDTHAHPGQFVVVRDEDVISEERYHSLLERRHIETFGMSEEATYLWKDWMVVEHAVFGHRGGSLREFIDVKAQIPEMYTIARYLQEKLPHVLPAFAIARNRLSLTTLPSVHRNMWSRVLFPELQELQRQHGYLAYVAFREIEKRERLDIKIYFEWDQVAWSVRGLAGGLYGTSWGQPQEYFSFDWFYRSLQESARPGAYLSSSATTTPVHL